MADVVREWSMELFRRRDLLYVLTWREIKLNYKKSRGITDINQYWY